MAGAGGDVSNGDVRYQRMVRKARLHRELTVLTLCVNFYGWGRILGWIPEHPGSSAQV